MYVYIDSIINNNGGGLVFSYDYHYLSMGYGIDRMHLYAHTQYTPKATEGEERQTDTNALAFDILRCLGDPDGRTIHITSRMWEQCV